MSNLSYCRFQNTAADLRDCVDHACSHLEGDERRSRLSVLRSCVDILESIGLVVEDPESKTGEVDLDSIMAGLDPEGE